MSEKKQRQRITKKVSEKLDKEFIEKEGKLLDELYKTERIARAKNFAKFEAMVVEQIRRLRGESIEAVMEAFPRKQDQGYMKWKWWCVERAYHAVKYEINPFISEKEFNEKVNIAITTRRLFKDKPKDVENQDIMPF